MRAARWHGRRDVRVEDVPRPDPGPDEVLIAIELCGICGTDAEEYRAGPLLVPVDEPNPLTGKKAPLILGHEMVGTVVDYGRAEDARRGPRSSLDGPPIGARVIPDGVLGCGTCWWCRHGEKGVCPDGAEMGQQADGGLAEYVVAAARRCVVVPEHVPSQAAVFAEPASVAVRAIDKAAPLTGASVVVSGAGTIGLLIVQVARGAGAGTVIAIDPHPARLELALAAGADVAVPPAEAAQATERVTRGVGADAGIECSGAAGAAAALTGVVRRQGTVVLVGMHGGPEALPLLDVVLGERRLVGSASHLWDRDVTAAVSLLAAGVLDPTVLPTERVPLERVVEDGFEAAGEPRKIIIDPTGEERAAGR